MSRPIHVFVFGLGYSATVFAREMRDGAVSIAGTVRGEEKAERLAREKFAATVFAGSAPGRDVGAGLARATHLLASIAPGETGDPALQYHRVDILAARDLAWIGYLSTVGVYGNYGGAWVSERTTPHPVADRLVKRLAAEAAWRAVAAERGVPLAIFRIAGIYGPGRNAFVNLAEGKAHRIVKPGQIFNRVHVADIAQALAASATRGASGIYNLADDEPAPPQDVVALAASLMGVPPPPEVAFEAADLSEMARSFYADNRRVSNRRIKQELGVTLRYPTYRDGLAALWQAGNWRG